MKTTRLSLFILLLLLVPTAAATSQEEAQADAKGARFFEAKIRPVLVKHCYECHSSESGKARGGLKLDTQSAISIGGDTGPAIVPRNAAESLLYQSILYANDAYQMPPKGKLPESVIADIRTWIEMGAPDPRTAEIAPDVASTIDIEQGRKYWAYQAPTSSPVPKSEKSVWARTAIDHHVIARLNEENLKPVSDATPETLVRRLYFNLHGLPPSSEEYRRWTQRLADAPNDVSKQAVLDELLDVLLDSPRYGERWGRHWLDVARYAESTGGDHNNIYQHAWRYRDYVIDSFNADKPFDQFIREQIAGDLLPIADDQEWANNVIATGFLTLGVKLVGEEDQQKFFADLVDEQIDSTTRAFLATTVACARCHDHKSDPIPQTDYYAMAGIFRSTETHYGLLKAQARQATTLLDLTGMGPPPGTPELDQEELAELIKKRDDAAQAVSDAMQRIRSGENVFRGMLRRLRSQRDETEAALQAFTAQGEPRVFAMGTQDRDLPLKTRLLVRGEIDQPAQQVARGVLQVAAPRNRYQLPSETPGSGRVELANWIAWERNPLTARVIANRVWHWMFGQGLVKTVDDFGANGDPPTHPELLDYLALRLIENNWSIKTLVKEIALSRTWQLSSEFHEDNFSTDPDNRLLWRMNKRRLEGEAIRDAMLAASGELDLERPLGTYLREVGEGGVGQNVFEPSIRAIDANTRSIYLPRVRNVLPEMLEVFDAPDASLVTGARQSTSSPLQALFLMNNPFVHRQATALAKQVERLPIDRRIETLYERLFARRPTARELQLGTAFLESDRPEFDAAERETTTRTIQPKQGFGGRRGQGAGIEVQAKETADSHEMSRLESYCQALLSTTEFQTLD